MTPRDPQRLNFNEPRQLSVAEARLLQRWQQNTCERITEGWSTILFAPIGVRAKSVQPLRYRQALKELADPGVGAVLQLSNEEIPSILAFPSGLMLGLLSQMLGEASGAWPEARNLSPLEETMCELLLQTVVDAASDGWPGIERLRCDFVESCRPRRCRRLPAESELIACRWEITCGYGTAEVVWLIPRPELEQLLASEDFSSIAVDHQADLETLVMSLPVEIKVELGRTVLSVAEMANLSAGDVLILDQAVHRPLSASVSDKVRWTGTPCRIGPRQALQVNSLVEPSARGVK